MPKKLRERVERAMGDPALLSLEGDVALVCARVGELLEQMGKVDCPPWGQAVESLNSLAIAVQGGDLEAIQSALAEHSALVRSGAEAGRNVEELWRPLQRALLDKAKLVEAESKRKRLLNLFLSATEAWVLIESVMRAVKDTVREQHMLEAIQRRINMLWAPLRGRSEVVDMPPTGDSIDGGDGDYPATEEPPD
jgi:hypothetical protein